MSDGLVTNDVVPAVAAPSQPRLSALVSALLLCALFAAAGVPRGDSCFVDATRVEFGERIVRGSHPRAIANCRAAEAPRTKEAIVAIAAMPRVLPRTRSIDAGGLPPPRAPTV